MSCFVNKVRWSSISTILVWREFKRHVPTSRLINRIGLMAYRHFRKGFLVQPTMGCNSPDEPVLLNSLASNSFTTSFQHDGSKLHIYLHNVGGIRSQLLSIRSAILTCHYDVIILIETWLDETVFSSDLFDPTKWIVFRCDRHDLGDNRNGGGVLIAT